MANSGEAVPSPLRAAEPYSLENESLTHPLSDGQRALWFLQKLAPDSSAYNVVHALRIRSTLDKDALRKVIPKVVDRHAALRTTFPVVEGQPVQVVHRHMEVALREIDASAWSEAELNARLAQEVHRPFDLERGPIVRVNLLARSESEHILQVAIHHIVTDLWSMTLLLHDLGVMYSAERAGTSPALSDLPVQYVDYVRERAELLAGPEGERLWSYWKTQLAGDLPTLDLPIDRPRPPVQTYRGASQAIDFDARLTQRLKSLAREKKANLFTVLLAAFQVLLHRYTGQEDFLLGCLKSGRSPRLARIVGYFVNPVVLRGDLSGDPAFSTLVERVRQNVAGASKHDSYPFSLLVERLQPARDLSRSPIFQVAFGYQKTSRLVDNQSVASIDLSEAGRGFDVGGLWLETMWVEERAVQFDLLLKVAERDEGLGASLEYNTDLFDAATIGRMLEHLRVLLEGIADDPDRGISSLPLLTAAGRRQLLLEWSDTRVEYPLDRCVHELFEAQVERTPEAVAVAFDGRQLAYRELNLRANQLAHYLRGLGVGPEVLVGICLERSLEMVVGLLGILKAGGAYVPLDPAYPSERLAFMIEDARVGILLTQQHLVEGLPGAGAQIVCLDSDWESVSRSGQELPQEIPQERPKGGATADSLAYVIYSSGSTGKPKGIQILHRALVNFCYSMTDQLGISDRDTLLAVTTISFDIAALELLLPLTVGARVVVAGRGEARDGRSLLEMLAHTGATFMQATPATWRLLLESGWHDEAGQLQVLCGGEALPRELAMQLTRRASSVWNLYGPTETTIWSAACRMNRESIPVSIGRPIANTRIYLLDAHLNPVPIGVPGELHIGGVGLARGYLNRPELTAEKFIPDPFSDDQAVGARRAVPQQRAVPLMYRTGDMARYLPDGKIEFLGRVDNQVKIRGFRVELGEIEATLGQRADIREAVVLMREDAPGDKRLVAYLVPQEGHVANLGELRSFLQRRLPDYMVPSAFVLLDEMPLTPNRKVDRKALPAPDGARLRLEEAYVAPRTPIEEELANLWCRLLRVDRVGIHDNFFDLGGHSLLATQVISRVRDTFHVEVPLLSLFETPTVAALALAIAQSQSQQVDVEQLDQLLDEIEQLSKDELRELLANEAVS